MDLKEYTWVLLRIFSTFGLQIKNKSSCAPMLLLITITIKTHKLNNITPHKLNTSIFEIVHLFGAKVIQS